MKDILQEIVERKHKDGLRETVPETRTSPVIPFPGPGFALIAEVKKASPSKGTFQPERDPVELARAYSRGGARALSVLTERNYFLGSIEHLQAAKAATDLPVLRKDFLTTRGEIEDAHRAGADAVLLIASVLGPRLREMNTFAREFGLAALIEVHDEEELGLALESGATLLGINNRNLATFEVDTETCFRLKRRIPSSIPVIAESGFSDPGDLSRLQKEGFAGVLIGESLVTSRDPEARVRDLVEAIR